MNRSDKESIRKLLLNFLSDKFDIPPEQASREVPLRELGLDSMLVLDVIMEAEDRLGTKLDDLTMPREATLADVVTMIQRNLDG
ncbi:MAG: acyl carrier protein [Dokdonella sp.]